MATWQLDKMTVGKILTLDFGNHIDDAVFIGITGEGDHRKAHLVSATKGGALMPWEAYRFNGRWAFGSSAERVSIIGVRNGIPGAE